MVIIALCIIIIIAIIWINNTRTYNTSYYLDLNSEGFLSTNSDEKTKYVILDSYDAYLSCVNNIDQWAEDNYDEFVDERAETIKKGFSKGNYNEKFFKNKNLILVETIILGSVLHDIKLENVEYTSNDVLNVSISEEYGGVVGGGEAVLFFIAASKEVSSVNIDVNSTNTSVSGEIYKPIIYLYPTENTEVSVVLGNSDNITVSYPKYSVGWNVLAKPDGTLTDLITGKNLYSLYYEGTNTYNFEETNEGFIVKGEDVTEFLEEKLALLGLTERETEEFIIYWLPILQENEYNYIKFASIEEIEENMPLEINPNPDTIIRILMTYKGLEKPIEVEEQKLITPERSGFVAVEWGRNRNSIIYKNSEILIRKLREEN